METHTDYEQHLTTSLEDVYRKADNTMMWLILLFTAVSLVEIVYFGIEVVMVVAPLGTAAIGFAARFLVPQRQIKMILICLSIVLFMLWIAAFSRGYGESRFAFFIAIFFMALYQMPRLVIVFGVLAVGYGVVCFGTVFFYPESLLAPYVKEYLLNVHSISYEQAAMSIFWVVVADVLSIQLSRIMRSRTISNIEKEFHQREQLAVYEKNMTMADQIAGGNLDINYDVAEDDKLGQSLNNMRKNLETAAIRDRNERLVSEGVAKVNDVLRGDDVTKLYHDLVQVVVKHLNAQLGSLFVMEEKPRKEEDVRHMELRGMYALNKERMKARRMPWNEGLLGQALVNQKIMVVEDVPEEFVGINSALGDARPKNVYLCPLVYNDELAGGLEIASFYTFEDHHLRFLEIVAEVMASAILRFRINERTKLLLSESQEMEAELKAQQEELQQNLEEIEATREESNRKVNYLENENAELRKKLEEFTGEKGAED